VLGDLKQRYHEYFTAQGPSDSFSQNYFRAERVSYNLMGDPEFSVITDTPVPLGASPVRQPFIGETSVQIQVTGRGGPLSGALIHLTGAHGDVRARTNATGVATLPYDFSDLSSFNLTVTAPNHLPLSTSFAPAVPDHNLAFEHPSLSAPSMVRRGDSVTVTGTVVARGIVPYRNVVVELRTGSPSTGPIVAVVSLAQVTPGLAQPVTATMSFDTSGKFLVYATIDPDSEQAEDTHADNVAFATIEVNYPPQFAPLPVLSVAAGRALPEALNLPSYVTDRDHAVIALDFRVAAVSDPRVEAFVVGPTLGIKASPGSPPSVSVTLEASDGLESTRADLTVLVTREDQPPVLDPVMEAEAFVGEPFALQLHAADPEGAPLLWSDDSPLFEIDPTGRIAFTPTASEMGRFAVTVTASDGRVASSHTFLLVVAQRAHGAEVHNLPVLRASAGHPIVLDLNLISSDPGTTFVTDRQDVSIDGAARTLRFTPAPGEPRLETIRLIVAQEGGSQSIVVVTVEVAAAPAPSGDVLIFAGVGLAVAAIVGLTLMRSRQVRLRDERIFRIEGKPPKKAQKPKAAKDGAAGAKDPPAVRKGTKDEE
jgi:hypothetical protein